jgi:hypothetical protein
MKLLFRAIIIIIVLFGILGFARNSLVGAANSPQSVSPLAADDCENGVSQGKCRDSFKDKEKCRDHKDNCGTVKPPPHHISIPETGDYSVGAFCTLSVVFNDPETSLEASVETPLPHELPDKVHKIRQGCDLDYYTSNQPSDELPSASGSATICFAAMPQQQMTVYYYDTSSPNATWVPLETTVQGGKACATSNQSGTYVATFQTP